MSEFENLLGDLEGLDEAELRSLIERAARIQELTEHPGWGFFIDYLIGLSTASQRRVVNGRCKTMEEYKYETGRIAGLVEAMEAPARLMEQTASRQRLAEQAGLALE